MKIFLYLFAALLAYALISCSGTEEQKPEEDMPVTDSLTQVLQSRVDIYAPTEISLDISKLTDKQKLVVETLIIAGKIGSEMFWKQSSFDGIALRDSLKQLSDESSLTALEFMKINYGPYDLIDEGKRYVGEGSEKKPAQANLYPQDLTKEEFEAYLEAHPEQKEALMGEYTIVVRDGENLQAVPYHEAYPEMMLMAEKLETAAGYAENASLKAYLIERANAFRTGNYYESDMKWMDLKDNDIDVIIGPIESYEDGWYNRKTAFEAVVVIKDQEATEQLQMFKKHIIEFEQKLPYDAKYIRKTVGGGNHILNIANVAYSGGDCQAGTKTIACNLPNNPAVRSAKGSKNTMYKNIMEAKFDKIVVPIAEKLLDPSLVPFADKKAFMSFVTMHEISHSLGRDYVFGNDKLSVREALKDRYSAIEECKADILGLYNHKHLIDAGIFPPEYKQNLLVTYLAGLYRSIRFGVEEAHGKANLIQLNYLFETGAIVKQADGKLNINADVFFDKAAELAKFVLTMEAEGDYAGAGAFMEQYAKMTPAIQEAINSLQGVPRDLNTTYSVIK